jgi:hypothetical protein
MLLAFQTEPLGALILLSCRLTVLAGFFTKQNPSLVNPVPLFVLQQKLLEATQHVLHHLKWICNVHCQNQQPICRSAMFTAKINNPSADLVSLGDGLLK